MVKDWGMSEKVGLRTIEGPKGLSSGDVLGPNTNEMVREKKNVIKSMTYD